MSRGRGHPPLRPGQASVRVAIVTAESDRALWDEAAERAGVDRSTWIRDVLGVVACEELGLDVDAWVERAERVPVDTRRRCR